MEFSSFNKQAKNTSYRHGNLYEVGSHIQNTDGEVGKIHRRGPNYVIAVTEEGDMFRSWVTDIKEYKQWNTSGADQTHRLVGTNKFRKFTERMTPGSDYDMWKKPTEVNRRINKTKPIKEETMSANVRLSAWMLGLSLAEQQEIASKMDKIILSGDVIEGILESFGTEKMQDLAVEYASIVSGKELTEGMKQARKNVGASTCWDGYKAQGTKKKGGKEVPNCVKEDEETVSEHHQKDENGKVIEHEDTTPSSVEEGLKQARKNVGASKCWDGKKIGSPPTKTKNGKEVPNCVPEEIIKSSTFVISETPKGDMGKDRATKVKDRSARSYGGSDTYGAKYNAPIRRDLHDLKRGVKKDKGHVNRPNKPTSKFDDDRQGGSHWHNQGQGLAGTKKHGKTDYDEPSRKKVKKENYSWRERMDEKYFGVPDNIRAANKRLSGPGPHSTKDKYDVLMYNKSQEKKNK